MDHQGFDPLTHAPVHVAAFTEHIECQKTSTRTKKTTKVSANKGKKKGNDSERVAMLHVARQQQHLLEVVS